jgi:ribose/xylose/arabinose/galactoside ABC-type transport system permease subunit
VIIGGTSLFGGTAPSRQRPGAILFAEINNGLQVINVAAYRHSSA